VFELSQRALEHGARLCRAWMERVLVCEETGDWPGYCEATVPLDVPDDEEELTFGDEEAA
jgi:hypothetical protein